MQFLKLALIGSMLALAGCANIMEGQRKAADAVFGTVTSDTCRVVRAQNILDAAKELWPAPIVQWSGVDRTMLRFEAAQNKDIVSGEYAAAMIAALAPVFVDLGKSVVGVIEEGRADGWTLNSLVAPLMQINGVPQRLIMVQGQVAECEAVHGAG